MKEAAARDRGRLVRRLVAFTAILVLTVTGIGYARFASRRDRTYSPGLARLSAVRRAPSDAAAVARGDHLAHTLAGCASCHGDDLGGRTMSEDVMLRISAPNLTRGAGSGVVGYTEEDWLRAIAHGVGRSGRSLLVMPSRELASFADTDLAALIAYLRSLRPVDRTLAPTAVSPVGAVVLGLTAAPIFSAEEIAHTEVTEDARAHEAPPAGPTRAYGEYLANVCRGCHGADLRGGIVVHPGAPPSAELSPKAMAAWTHPAFVRALREGKKRDGSTLDAAMPWDATRGLTDDELRALWLALRRE